jgi:hypothetical protein
MHRACSCGGTALCLLSPYRVCQCHQFARFTIKAVERVGVQELSSPKKCSIHFAQRGLSAQGPPIICDCPQLMANDLNRLTSAQMEVRRCVETGYDLAAPVLLNDQHCLANFPSCPRLRTNIVGRVERQRRVVPKSSVISGMIVGVTNKNVEA